MWMWSPLETSLLHTTQQPIQLLWGTEVQMYLLVEELCHLQKGATLVLVIFGFGISGIDQHQLCQRHVAYPSHVVWRSAIVGFLELKKPPSHWISRNAWFFSTSSFGIYCTTKFWQSSFASEVYSWVEVMWCFSCVSTLSSWLFRQFRQQHPCCEM